MVAPWFALPPAQFTRQATIIGAGLAGCQLTYSLCTRGWQVALLDAMPAPATRASAHGHAIVRPHLTRQPSVPADFHRTAFQLTRQRLSGLEADEPAPLLHKTGLVQLLRSALRWQLPAGVFALSRQQVRTLTGLSPRTDALYFPDAGWVDAGACCRALLRASAQTGLLHWHPDTRVDQIEPVTPAAGEPGRWRLVSGNHVLSATTLVIAAGAASEQLAQGNCDELALIPVAGQTTRCTADPPFASSVIVAGQGFLLPLGQECIVGATYQRHSSSLDRDPADDLSNLTRLEQSLPSIGDRLTPNASWREIRLTTPDRMPMIGPVPDSHYYHRAYYGLRHGPRHQQWSCPRYRPGLYLLTGFGSRGAVTSTLAAELLTGVLDAGARSERHAELERFASLVHPGRFLIRRLRRSNEK